MSKDGEDRLKSEERMLNSLFGFNFKRIKKGQEAVFKIEPSNAGNFQTMCLCYHEIIFSYSGQSRDVEKETAGSDQGENLPTIPKMYYNGGCTLIEPCNDGNLV